MLVLFNAIACEWRLSFRKRKLRVCPNLVLRNPDLPPHPRLISWYSGSY